MLVRVRYAPSPTGYQHIGGVRTALFNYLFARAKGGRFILRIEDTDRARFMEEALEDIYRTFDWLGFHWDEGPDIDGAYGPYCQSERVELYQECAEELVNSGHAYFCYCSPERLESIKKIQQKKKMPLGYDRHCRNLTDEERKQLEKQSRKKVIRFKVPVDGSTSFYDELLGTIEKANSDINPDPIILKSDKFPTYHLANVVDDHSMKITHILRAQEWLSSCPLHVLLYRAFGWEVPKYCHLPMVLGQDGQKLSKRHGATRVVEFIEKGYLPEAIINYIALLGWSFDDSREFFTLKDLEELFSIDSLNKAPAVFDYKKLDWFNGMYIRKLPEEELHKKLIPYLRQDKLIGEKLTADEERIVTGLVPLVQKRLNVLSDVAPMVRFLSQEVAEYNLEDLIPKKLDIAETERILEKLAVLLRDFADSTNEENEQSFRDLAKEMGVKLGDLLMPLRVALTGSRISPPLLESIRLLGQEKTMGRINRVLKLLALHNDKQPGRS